MAFEEKEPEQDTVDSVVAEFEHPEGRIDKVIYRADRPVMHTFAANRVNTIQDLDVLLHDLYAHVQQPETATKERIEQLMVRLQNAHTYLKFIGPGGDFMRGLTEIVDFLVDRHLRPGANPPTEEELELWRLEGLDETGYFDTPVTLADIALTRDRMNALPDDARQYIQALENELKKKEQ